MAKGRFITLEGGEGTGKSTQVTRLVAALRKAGKTTIATREPGGSAGAEEIRALLVSGDTSRWDAVTEALLHFAARRDHLRRTIWPAIEASEWVVSDRFADSTMAYQGYGYGLGREVVETLYKATVGSFGPDLTLVLDLPVDLGLERARGRGGYETRYEAFDIGFHTRVRQGFLEIAETEPKRCVVIDASRDPDEVAHAVRAAVQMRLGVELS